MADPLAASLEALLNRLGAVGADIMLAGGYGLYLKQTQLAQRGVDTLIPVALWPEPRTTQDLDLLLPAEIVGDASTMASVRTALDELGYQAVPGSEFLQFARALDSARTVKVDLLTVQTSELEGRDTIRFDDRRARPRGNKSHPLHAHPTDGALDLGAGAVKVNVRGGDALGNNTGRISVPGPFAYLLMKLTAYRDRKDDPNKALGQHHTLDIYRIVAMLSRTEFGEVRAAIKQHAEDAQVRSCAEVAREHFLAGGGAGLRAIQRHPLYRRDMPLEPFVDAMRELFDGVPIPHL